MFLKLATVAQVDGYGDIIVISMDKDRKQSDDLEDSEEEGTLLFPRTAAIDLQDALEVLVANYNPKTHAEQLINCCFRCHHSQISRAYDQLRQKVHPDLQEPRISSLYLNDQFVDLREVGRRQSDHQLTIPEPLIEPISKELAPQLDALFQRFGFIPHLQRFLLFYPTYLEKHLAVESNLFESGKLQPKTAYFLALCAAAEMGSPYMINRYLRLYLKSGGDTQWYTHKAYPPKIKSLLALNRLMARCPWEMTSELIESLLQDQTVHWNTNQLARYVQLLAFAHQNSTIALSVGLLPEDDRLLGELHLKEILSLKQDYDQKIVESSQTEQLAVLIPFLREEDDHQDMDHSSEFKKEVLECKKEQLNGKRSVKTSMRKQNEAVQQYMKEINNELNKQELYQKINQLVDPLLPPFELIEKRGNKTTTTDYSEYNYKFMAYPLLNSLTHETADKIENLIAYSEIMSRGNFGSVNITANRTKEFRKAVRYYAENLCGYTHIEYDFKNNVSTSLPMALKFYIRLVMMSPLHINRQVLNATNHESGKIQCFDLGHLAVLIANTKMSIELMHTVQAFDL